MRIKQIFIYPIKSCAGTALKEAKYDSFGFEHDRRWMIVNEHNLFFASQRQYPKIALIKPHLTLTSLLIDAPGMEQFVVRLIDSRSLQLINFRPRGLQIIYLTRLILCVQLDFKAKADLDRIARLKDELGYK